MVIIVSLPENTLKANDSNLSLVIISNMFCTKIIQALIVCQRGWNSALHLWILKKMISNKSPVELFISSCKFIIIPAILSVFCSFKSPCRAVRNYFINFLGVFYWLIIYIFYHIFQVCISRLFYIFYRSIVCIF